MTVPGSVNPLLTYKAPAGYSISRSLRFNSSDSAYLSRTPSSAGNRKTWTWSAWVKFANNSSFQNIVSNSNSANNNGFYFALDSTGKLDIHDYVTSNYTWRLLTTAVFRDFSAWYHIVFTFDTTQATSSSRTRLYINGSEITVFSVATYPTQNADGVFNNTQLIAIGNQGAFNANYFNGYLADIHFIDGQALTPSSFTEVSATTGQLIPKAYTGSFGTNGFWLPFSDNSTAAALGTDTSGNSPANNWTPNNLSVTAGAGNDSLVDVPTNGSQTDTGVGGEVRGNYCTLNPLQKGSGVSLANGNLDGSIPAGSAYIVVSTIGMTSGKWYAEYTATGGSYHVVGIAKSNVGLAVAGGLGGDANGWGYDAFAGKKVTGGVQSTYGSSYTTNDVIGIAFDADNGTLTFYKNNVSQGTAFTGLTSGPYFFASGTDNSQFTWNWGARSFAYTAPSGFKALCTANLPAPSVTKPSTVFDVKLYTATDGVSGSVSGVNFSPDLIWIKSRAVARSNVLMDKTRGASSVLWSDLTNAELSSSIYVSSFNTDGFNYGTAGDVTNGSTVAWMWDAGDAANPTTNTAGSITGGSQVRANATSGFSIVTYSGQSTTATVGHGLGAEPHMIIVKNRTGTPDEWFVYHKTLGNTQRIRLNTTSAADTQPVWNNTSPTSSVFTVQTGWYTSNYSGHTHVAYCFAPVAGYSAFGSYTGNGSSTDGPFVYTGFRPRWVMWKRTDSSTGGAWVMLDAARNTYNIVNLELYANSSMAEGTFSYCDFLSNGFKLRTSDVFGNASGGTYVFAAFAESPFNYARAR